MIPTSLPGLISLNAAWDAWWAAKKQLALLSVTLFSELAPTTIVWAIIEIKPSKCTPKSL